jgi:hypothetical protein
VSDRKVPFAETEATVVFDWEKGKGSAAFRFFTSTLTIQFVLYGMIFLLVQPQVHISLIYVAERKDLCRKNCQIILRDIQNFTGNIGKSTEPK